MKQYTEAPPPDALRQAQADLAGVRDVMVSNIDVSCVSRILHEKQISSSRKHSLFIGHPVERRTDRAPRRQDRQLERAGFCLQVWSEERQEVSLSSSTPIGSLLSLLLTRD
jgi:hypothetical protein